MRWLMVALLMVGCASAPKHAPMPKSVALEFKGQPGTRSETRYFSNSRVLTYEDNQLLRDRQEIVDFSVANHILAYDPARKVLEFEVKTVRKDGTVELHDLAFPELGEQLDYVMRANGEMLKVGHLPPQSLFYVPALPIPDKPVEVGDTWTMDHSWLSAKDGVPLSLSVVAILKGIVPCEKTATCADIEISGNVGLLAEPTVGGARFESRVWGRLLFSLDRGDVLWSEMRSRELMGVSADRMAVNSCMVSEMKTAPDFHIDFSCDPGDRPVDKVPVL